MGDTGPANIRAAFETALTDHGGVVLVDFFATWCGPCHMLAPVIDRVEKKFDGRATVARVDIDKFGALAAAYQVQSIPTLLLFKDGQLLGRLQRTRTERGLTDAIEAAIAGELMPSERSLDSAAPFTRGASLD
jgi:thioredoxin 1